MCFGIVFVTEKSDAPGRRCGAPVGLFTIVENGVRRSSGNRITKRNERKMIFNETIMKVNEVLSKWFDNGEDQVGIGRPVAGILLQTTETSDFYGAEGNRVRVFHQWIKSFTRARDSCQGVSGMAGASQSRKNNSVFGENLRVFRFLNLSRGSRFMRFETRVKLICSGIFLKMTAYS